jgi:hypothetical protein
MSCIEGHDNSSAAAGSAPVRQRAATVPALERAAFARALHAAQRRSGDALSDRAVEAEAPCCEGDGATVACNGVIGAMLTDQARQTTTLPLSPPPAGLRAACPRARAAAAARQGSPQQEETVQESPATIEWLTPLLPSGRLTLSRAEGGAWTLCCQAADLEALRGAVAQLADRFEQRALGPLQVRVD